MLATQLRSVLGPLYLKLFITMAFLQPILADTIISHNTEVKSVGFRVGPMLQKFEAQPGNMRWTLSEFGVRLDFTLSGDNYAFLYSSQLDKMWTLNVTKRTFHEGLLLDWVEKLKKYPDLGRKAPQSFPLLSNYSLSTTGKKGRLNLLTCNLYNLVNRSGKVIGSTCILSVESLNSSKSGRHTYKAFQDYLSENSNIASLNIVRPWPKELGFPGIEIFRTIDFQLLQAPVSTSFTIKLRNISADTFQRNYFLPPSDFQLVKYPPTQALPIVRVTPLAGSRMTAAVSSTATPVRQAPIDLSAQIISLGNTNEQEQPNINEIEDVP